MIEPTISNNPKNDLESNNSISLSFIPSFLSLPGATLSTLKTFKDYVTESQNPEDFLWKIKKYEAMVFGLRNKVEKICLKEAEWLDPILNSDLSEDAFIDEFKKPLKSLFNDSVPFTSPIEITQDYLQKLRCCYTDFIISLRIAHSTFEDFSDPPILAKKLSLIINEICFEKIAGIGIYRESLKLIELFKKIEIKDPKSIYHYSICQEAAVFYEKICNAPSQMKTWTPNIWGNSLKDKIKWDFNPHGSGANFSHKWLKLKIDNHPIEFLAFGSPTREYSPLHNWFTGADIIPELTGYITHLKKIQKKHLYINLQNPIFPSLFSLSEDESARCHAIHNLESNCDDAMHIITLSKNSDWYHQEIDNLEMKFSDFKSEFLAQLFSTDMNESGCLISEKLKYIYLQKAGLLLDEWSSKAMEAIYEYLFLNLSEPFNKHNRKCFIELFYYFLILELSHKLEIDFLNTSCKDGIDRGVSESSKIFALLHLANNQEIDSDEWLLNLFVRALMVRKRAIDKKRLDRTLEVVEFAYDRLKDFQKLHQYLLPKAFIEIDRTHHNLKEE